MQKNLVSKAAFAKLAGVHASSVTRLWDSLLRPAVLDKKIDPDHPVAVEYIEKQRHKRTPAPLKGIDPRYEEAVEWCQKHSRYSAAALNHELGIPQRRAGSIIRMMKEGGLVPEPGKNLPPVAEPPPPPPAPRSKKAKAAAKFEAEEIEVPEHLAEFADWPLRKLIAKFGTDAAFVGWLKAVKLIEDVEEKKLKNATTKGELIARSMVKTHLVDTFDGAHIRMLTDGVKTMAVRSHAMALGGSPVEEIERMQESTLSKFIKPTKSKVSRILKNA